MGESIRVRGLVQGVGFRPTVWRLAQDHGLVGDVCNDGEGVLIRIWAGVDSDPESIDRFCASLRAQCPPLARIDSIERATLGIHPPSPGFRILASSATRVRTGVVPDAATCGACAGEIRDPRNRRYRYPFTNCTHCGPRLSIVRAIPYDRANTSMGVFTLCPTCAAEYADPADRRFHAQPNACPLCGPRLWLADPSGLELDPVDHGCIDAIALASRLLAEGRILAIKGIGGFHLACDAAAADAVAELRRRKRRYQKPFALMARDLGVIRRYCPIGEAEAELLTSPAAPIVLLDRGPRQGPPEAARLAPEIAPGQGALGFMLPYSPLHHLLLADWDRPLVMTSGNRSEEPQCIENRDALDRLGSLADFALLHDRAIVNRVDDSVVRVMAQAPRLLRRARGYAPAPIALPSGFALAPQVLAFGGELKSTACLVKEGQAYLTQHLGDLEDAATAREYKRTLDLYRALFEHHPRVLAVDLHPDYRSTLTGRDWAARLGLPLVSVQHHHAHIASVLADSRWPLEGGPVLGIALDGLGYGPDGTLWGCELLIADYRRYRRVAWLRPTPMPGGARAILEPWRNLLAQIESSLGWESFQGRWPDLVVTQRLAAHPIPVLQAMMARRLNSPLSSSAGRLFDAVAAALGVGGDAVTYEGQAAIELEALATTAMADAGGGYPFAVSASGQGAVLDPAPLWSTLFGDLESGTAPALIAARFHLGFCDALATLAGRIAVEEGLDRVALSGGVLQNRLILEGLCERLVGLGLTPLTHRQVPANDGGLSLGQAAVAAALGLEGSVQKERECSAGPGRLPPRDSLGAPGDGVFEP